jgi:hypothetical protein
MLGGIRETLYQQRIRRMSAAWRVARRRDRRVPYSVLVGGRKERGHLEDIGVEERIILKLIFNRWDGETCTGFIWLRVGTGGRKL